MHHSQMMWGGHEGLCRRSICLIPDIQWTVILALRWAKTASVGPLSCLKLLLNPVIDNVTPQPRGRLRKRTAIALDGLSWSRRVWKTILAFRRVFWVFKQSSCLLPMYVRPKVKRSPSFWVSPWPSLVVMLPFTAGLCMPCNTHSTPTLATKSTRCPKSQSNPTTTQPSIAILGPMQHDTFSTPLSWALWSTCDRREAEKCLGDL